MSHLRDIDPGNLVIWFVALLFSLSFHEASHAWTSEKFGDDTGRLQGRITLNPLPHVDPVGSILLPAVLALFHSPVVLGWAKPVPIQWANLRNPRNDPVKVALAGPVANLLLAVAFAVIVRLAPSPDAPGGGWASFLAPLSVMGYAGVVMNCGLALFNLIPVPPLDGSWVLMRFLPLRHIITLQQFRLLGIALVAILLSSHRVSHFVLEGPLRATVRACLGLVGAPDVGAEF